MPFLLTTVSKNIQATQRQTCKCEFNSGGTMFSLDRWKLSQTWWRYIYINTSLPLLLSRPSQCSKIDTSHENKMIFLTTPPAMSVVTITGILSRKMLFSENLTKWQRTVLLPMHVNGSGSGVFHHLLRSCVNKPFNSWNMAFSSSGTVKPKYRHFLPQQW